MVRHEDELDVYSHNMAWIAGIFYNKSQGHPLHLRYTLKALQEQNIPVTKENIERLPGIPHKSITEYYKELWRGLPEAGRAILYLFATCDFPWTRVGIVDCLSPHGYDQIDLNEGLKQIKHLVVRNPMGFQPFHSSIIAFIKGQDDYVQYSKKMKEYVLEWLKRDAPTYLKWANGWILQAELEDYQPIINGPCRDWAINAIIMRYPPQDIFEILKRSSWFALSEYNNIPRFIETGLLYEYVYMALDMKFRSEILEKLFYPQLVLKEDPELLSKLETHIGDLSENEIVLLAECEFDMDDRSDVVDRCFYELDHRVRRITYAKRDEISRDPWNLLIIPYIKVAALSDEVDISNMIKFALDNRVNNLSYYILNAFAEALRTHKRAELMRKLLKMSGELGSIEYAGIVRHAVLFALEEDIDINYEVIQPKHYSNPFTAIYAFIRKLSTFNVNEVRFPSSKLLISEGYLHDNEYKKIEDFFYNSFFCSLANYLWNNSKCNEKWLKDFGSGSWSEEFSHRLNGIACDLAKLLISNNYPSFGWFYDQIREFHRPSFREDTVAYPYIICAERAIYPAFRINPPIRSIFHNPALTIE